MAVFGWNERNMVYRQFNRWKHEGKKLCFDGEADSGGPRHLSALCGRSFEDRFRWEAPCTEAEVEICRRLVGPHGYAYYRTLVAQMGLADGQRCA